MTENDIDRIQCAIRHIQTSVDIDPWAREIAVEAMTNQMEALKNSPTQMTGTSDLISRQAAIDAVEFGITYAKAINKETGEVKELFQASNDELQKAADRIKDLPSAQPTLYGYNVEHLTLIAEMLRKENLPPERITEALTDIGRIVAIVRDEFVDNLRKAVENVGLDKQTGGD